MEEEARNTFFVLIWNSSKAQCTEQPENAKSPLLSLAGFW